MDNRKRGGFQCKYRQTCKQILLFIFVNGFHFNNAIFIDRGLPNHFSAPWFIGYHYTTIHRHTPLAADNVRLGWQIGLVGIIKPNTQ